MSRTRLTILTSLYLLALLARGAHVIDHLGHFEQGAHAEGTHHGESHHEGHDDDRVFLREHCGLGPCQNPDHEHNDPRAPHADDECFMCNAYSGLHTSLLAEGLYRTQAPSTRLFVAERPFISAVSVELHSARGPPACS